MQNHWKKWEATGEATGRPLGRPLGGHWEATVIMLYRVLAVIFEHRFPSFRVRFLSEKSAATRRSFGDQRSTKKT